MSDRTWEQMDGWEKAWEVTKVVGGLALIVLAVLSGGSRVQSGFSHPGSGSVWTVGHGGEKGYGSWSSFRHK